MNKQYCLVLLFLLRSACAMDFHYDKQMATPESNQKLLAVTTYVYNNQRKSAAIRGIETKRKQSSEPWVANKKARATPSATQEHPAPCVDFWTRLKEKESNTEQPLYDNSDTESDDENPSRNAFLKSLDSTTDFSNERVAHKCTQCTRICSTEMLLAYHMERVHKYRRSHYSGYLTEKKSLKRNCDFENKEAGTETNKEFAAEPSKSLNDSEYQSECDKESDDREALHNLHSHSGVCPYCKNTYKLLKRHIASVHIREEASCLECGKIFMNKAKLNVHRKRAHTLKEKEPCPECGKEYAGEKLTSHRRTVHNVQKMKCPHCKKTYKLLDNHIANVHAQEEVSCPECGEIFMNRPKLASHMRNVHIRKDMPCPECGKIFKNRAKLTPHIRQVHNHCKMTCIKCGEECKNRDSLGAHMRKYHDTRKVHCLECGKKCKNRRALIDHKSYNHRNKD